MRLTIEHSTLYSYEQQVKHSTQYLRLTPQESEHQRIISWQLALPEKAVQTIDAFGNILHVLTLDRPHQSISIKATGVVEIAEDEVMDDGTREALSPLVWLRHTPLTQPDSSILAFAREYWQGGSPLDSLTVMMGEVLERMPYTPGGTNVKDTAAQVFDAGVGVCQDHAHVFVACCRSLGLPARYVSGYLYTPDSAHVATHAWVETLIEGRWHSFDITNNTRNTCHHLKLAVGFDYLDACPVRGVRLGGGDEGMETIAAVQRMQSAQ
ncbi:transglutaminase family protein [Buttiauxella gaviniae]|uniref:transglutaminase family protein n=1 Tax=Buttiauxella gaviniae TaxID=82990 RepID=UPI003C782C45